MMRARNVLMRARNGFTLLEMITALAIMVILGALVVPSIIASADRARVNGAQDSLEAIADAIDLFADRVDRYPRTLSQLVIPITTGDLHICGGTYTAGEAGRWAGPYLDRSIPAAGIPTGVGTLASVFSVQAHPSGIDYLRTELVGVLTEDAQALDRVIDGADGENEGTFRWSAPSGGVVTAYYLIPFRDC